MSGQIERSLSIEVHRVTSVMAITTNTKCRILPNLVQLNYSPSGNGDYPASSLGLITISTFLFLARPSGLALLAIG